MTVLSSFLSTPSSSIETSNYSLMNYCQKQTESISSSLRELFQKTFNHQEYLYNKLKEATKNNQPEKIATILKNSSKISLELTDLKGNTLLHNAARRGHIAAMQTLVENGANINAVNLRNETALHLAASEHHIKAVDYLLEKDAKVWIKDAQGNTALHKGCTNLPVTRSLLKYGANVKAQNKRGNTPLHFVASSRETQANTMIDILIEAGANINQTNGMKETPLHSSVIFGASLNAKKLIEKGANFNLQTIFKNSVLDLAIMYRRDLVEFILKEKGAEYNSSTEPKKKIPIHYPYFAQQSFALLNEEKVSS